MKGLHESGRSVRGIAQHLKRSPNGVSYALKSSRKKEKKGGRPPTLSDRQVWQIVRAAATGNFSAAELKAEYKLECSEVVWPLIIFSDEKKFNLDGPDGFKNYWRDLRSPPRRCMRPQNGGGSLMVWGAFGVKGKSELVVLQERQSSLSYIYTISEHLLPFAHRNYGTDFVFMQDNASIHVSDETKSFFKEIGYSSVTELTPAVMSAWESETIKELLDLMESMPARCFKVGNKNGDAIL
ncbi:Transposase [Phytophthora megakarya]|uniref:Transposase n=1 Tax=Phytophthora megakarya TaxID=4795 RepID=A0A225UNL6_9STRA|nr:Transposase [Phytophthora megakarya]